MHVSIVSIVSLDVEAGKVRKLTILTILTEQIFNNHKNKKIRQERDVTIVVSTTARRISHRRCTNRRLFDRAVPYQAD